MANELMKLAMSNYGITKRLYWDAYEMLRDPADEDERLNAAALQTLVSLVVIKTGNPEVKLLVPETLEAIGLLKTQMLIDKYEKLGMWEINWRKHDENGCPSGIIHAGNIKRQADLFRVPFDATDPLKTLRKIKAKIDTLITDKL